MNVDISDPSKLNAKTGSKEVAAGNKVPFDLADQQTLNGQVFNRTVYISPNNLNESDLNTLGGELKIYSKDDFATFIYVFSDKKAATEIRPKYQNEDPNLSKGDSDLYEKSFIGAYTRSGKVHNFTFCLNGYYLDDCKSDANKKIVKYN